jgi:hypothetical protein
MMNVASLELCETLYELSGWEDTGFEWANPSARSLAKKQPNKPYLKGRHKYHQVSKKVWRPHTICAAYDLGYLLRRLPTTIGQVTDRLRLTKGDLGWYAQYDRAVLNNILEDADTPEDAVAKLCIELFKQGVLAKDTP